MIELKLATVKDWKVICRLETEATSKYYTSVTTEKDIEDFLVNSMVYKIVYKKEVVGLISYVQKESNQIYINGLVVDKKYRGNQIGSKSTKLLLNKLIGKDLELVVHPRNSAAIIIYLKNGFEIIDWIPNKFGDNEPRLKLVKSSK